VVSCVTSKVLGSILSTIKKERESQMLVVTPVILATWEAKIGRVKVPGQSRQIVFETPISKITREKWDRQRGSSGRVPALRKALSSIPSPTNNK
jgi:hypothetical protein